MGEIGQVGSQLSSLFGQYPLAGSNAAFIVSKLFFNSIIILNTFEEQLSYGFSRIRHNVKAEYCFGISFHHYSMHTVKFYRLC